jgi:hypothetical protein
VHLLQRLARDARGVDVGLHGRRSGERAASVTRPARWQKQLDVAARALNTMMPSCRSAFVTSAARNAVDARTRQRQRACALAASVSATGVARTEQHSGSRVAAGIHRSGDAELSGHRVDAFAGHPHLDGPLNRSSQPASSSVRWRRVSITHLCHISQGPQAGSIHAPLAQAALHLLIGCAPDKQVELANACIAHLHLPQAATTDNITHVSRRAAASFAHERPRCHVPCHKTR